MGIGSLAAFAVPIAAWTAYMNADITSVLSPDISSYLPSIAYGSSIAGAVGMGFYGVYLVQARVGPILPIAAVVGGLAGAGYGPAGGYLLNELDVV